MNTMDNAKVIEALEKVTVFNYCEKLLEAAMHKITLFSILPYSAAANLSDPHPIVMIDDLSKLTALGGANCRN
jgi:hypothetical protein